MLASFASFVIALSPFAALPDAIKAVLEAQLPAWSQVTGNVTKSSEAEERIAVERATGDKIGVWLIDRKVKVSILREDSRHWLTNVVWCGAGAGRCDDVWKRTDAQWRSDNSTANHTGYAVYRDSLRLSVSAWSDPVPLVEFGKKRWDKGLCESGTCFMVSAKDSSVAHGAVRPDGSVASWDGGYVKGGPLETDLVQAYEYLLAKGREPKKGAK
ncbi:MAG: hypothetical protein AAB214_16570 [Fibrobacterota bacterium]